jgi:hypothetical protein
MGDVPAYINVGIIPTTASVIESDQLGTGRMITFPNWVQVGGLVSSNATLIYQATSIHSA